MTDQELFDTVAGHLLRQGKQATVLMLGVPCCRLRGDGGTKCALGVLIPDEAYYPAMEWGPWRAIERLGIVHGGPSSMLTKLQDCHDDHDPKQWPRILRDIARDFHLSPAVVDELAP